MFAKAKRWFYDRFAIGPLKDTLLKRRVPKTPWYYGDGAALMLLLTLLVLTGMALSLTYSPALESAYQSVRYIDERVFLGSILRAVHYWSAGMMVIVIFLHVMRQIAAGGFKPPREATWIIGVFLLSAVLFTSYLGYLLRADERSIYGIRVGSFILGNLPLVGGWLVEAWQGSSQLGPLTLTRLYALHTVIIPAVIFGLVGYHLYLVVYHGTVTPAEREQDVRSAGEQKALYEIEANSDDRGEVFFPATAAKSGVYAMVVVTIVAALALVVGPRPLMPAGNLVETSTPSEEWWFWWYSGLIALFPPWAAPALVVLVPVLSFLFLLLLPWLDRSPRRGFRRRPLWTVFTLLVIAAILALTDYRRRSPFTGGFAAIPDSLPPGARLTPEMERGWELFKTYGCYSCHAVGGQGTHIGPDLARIESYTRKGIEDYILDPPEGVAMPSYRGRLSKDELKLIVEFVHVAQTFSRQ